MQSILRSITGSIRTFVVPRWLLGLVLLGICPPLIGGWLAERSGNWELFERTGSMTAAIGLIVASRRYFQYGVRELAVLRAESSSMSRMREDVLMAKQGLALSAFGTMVSAWGKYFRWWSFCYLLVWAWF